MITVKGYSEAKTSGIYSNEVANMSEPLTVKYFKGNEVIANGLWKDIKAQVELAKGSFTFSIYIMTSKGVLANISFKGTSAGAWFNFTKKTRARLGDEWISIDGFTEGKTGSVTYYTPTMSFSGVIDNESALIADEKYKEIESYLEFYKLGQNSDQKTESKPITSMDVQNVNDVDLATLSRQEMMATSDPIFDANAIDDLPF